MDPRRLLPASLLLVTMLAIGAACGGSSGPSPAASPLAVDTPAPTDTPVPIATRDPALIAPIISALGAGDPEAVRPFVGFEQVPCSTSPVQGGPPACASDENNGQPVDVFYFSTCQGEYLRPAGIGEPLGIMAESSLYAVYRMPPEQRAVGQYSAILVDQQEPRAGQAWEAIIDNERIIALIFSCTTTPQALIELRRYTDAVPLP